MTDQTKIAEELVFISVDFNEKATFLYNDYISGLSVANRRKIMASLITLARDQLVKNYNQCPPSKKIQVSKDESFKDVAIGIRFLKGHDSSFRALLYFGEKVDPNYTVSEGLLTSLRILEQIERAI